MGLDNSIIIRARTQKAAEFLKNFKDLELEYEPGEYEFAYWRKCYNIRNRFLRVFDNKDYDGNGGTFPLKLKDLNKAVEQVLKYFLNEENWNEYGFLDGSIWSWSEILPHLGKQIYNIRRFLEMIEYYNEDVERKKDKLKNKDFEIFFVDSY